MSQQEIPQHRAFRWIIPNFTREYAQGCQPGSRRYSKNIVVMFEGVKTTWSLYIHPNGNEQDTKSHLSLFLYLMSSPKEIKAKCRLDLIKATSENHFNRVAYENCFAAAKSWGYSKFISHDALFADTAALLSNNNLTISCELILYTEPLTEFKCAVKNSGEFIAMDLRNMFDNEIETDFELRFNDGEILKAHKTILIARSPVFLKMLTTDMKESKDNFVDITDFDSKTMKELLRFVYSGEVRGLDEIATDLIFAAEKYQIEQLKLVCGDRIALKLSNDKEKVLDALIIAERISGLDNLIRKCVESVVKNYKEFSKSPKWKQLSKEMMAQILDEVMNYRCDIYYI